MHDLRPRHSWMLFGLLVLLMALTRFTHFGSPDRLPDASLAVFLLAGFYLRPVRMFALLLLTAFFVDLAAGSSELGAWCLSPAYWFLIPTYGLLWGAGRFGRGLGARGVAGAVALSLIAVGGLAGAFLISNASLYLFAGTVKSLGPVDFTRTVLAYFPAYVGSAALYLGLAGALQFVATEGGARLRAGVPG